MPDFRSFFDQPYVGAWDLNGKDVTVTISKVAGGEVMGDGGRKSRKLILYFEGKDKPMVCNKTNGKTIAALYGNDASDWIGKSITLYPTTTTMGSETKDCIRVRPRVPSKPSRGATSPVATAKDSEPRPSSDGQPEGEVGQ